MKYFLVNDLNQQYYEKGFTSFFKIPSINPQILSVELRDFQTNYFILLKDYRQPII